MVNFKVRARNLIRNYHTRNPYKIAIDKNIEVREYYLSPDMPTGFFKKVLTQKFIVLNLTKIRNEYEKDYVLAHELGHALFHSNNEAFFLHDHTLYNRGKFEIEANKFAAELLIDEREIDKYSLDEMCTSKLAIYFGVPEHLIEYKFKQKNKIF